MEVHQVKIVIVNVFLTRNCNFFKLSPQKYRTYSIYQ